MANEPGKAVPETILKKRKRDEEWAAKKAAKSSETRKYAKEKRSVIFKKAEQYVKEYRQQARLLLPAAHQLSTCISSQKELPADTPQTCCRRRT